MKFKRYALGALCVWAVLFGVAGTITATDFYVAPNASDSGDGSIGNPWKLQTACYQPGELHPGDTVWLRAGTYSGTYSCWINGTAANPIIVLSLIHISEPTRPY